MDSKGKNDTAIEGRDTENGSSDFLEPSLEPLIDHSSRDRYRIFIKQAVDGFYETNRSGGFIFFNEAFCRIFGRTHGEMENRNYREFMASDSTDSTLPGCSPIGDSQKVTRIRWKIIHKDGRIRTLDVTASPVIDSDGHSTGFRGMARDVTDEIQTQTELCKYKKKAEVLLTANQATEKRYHTFLEFLPLPLVVQNKDLSVAYINPAFQKAFGWTLKDLEENPFAHIPADQIKKTRTGKILLFQNLALTGVESKAITKDGRILDVKSYGSVFYDRGQYPAGIVVALRDITKSKKNAEISHALFKIAEALPQYGNLDKRLVFISNEVKRLLNTKTAHIILIDKENNEYYFRAGSIENTQSYHTFSQTRVKLDDTYLAGQVILSAESQIINDIDPNQYRSLFPDRKVRNIICVPMELDNQIIGAMLASNKILGKFDQEDIALLSRIAGMVALPIENARINDELLNSYEEIKSFNRAKDRMIDHLSHELRTPLSILSTSLKMLPQYIHSDPSATDRILSRCQRNLKRITAMQAKLEDIIHNPDQDTHQTLLALFELCSDELESLTDLELGPAAGQRIRRHIDALFKPRELKLERIQLGTFLLETFEELKPNFTHRRVDIFTEITENNVHLPAEVLSKIITGLLRNAVEYTPDGGKIVVTVTEGRSGPELTITDTGIGITQENQQLIFGNYFTTADIDRYATGEPYNFNAGGSGLDLLRLRMFSERYHFKIVLRSDRCRHIPTNADTCPGSTIACHYCNSDDHCHHSGGTSFTLQFLACQKPIL